MRACLSVFCLAVSAAAQVSVTTYRNDLARSGQNLKETILTRANVNSAQFGKIVTLPVDGQVYAQPLYLPSLAISGSLHNVVFVATEHDSVYAFDADSTSTTPLWHVNLASASETTAKVTDVLNCASISPEVGVTGTPVIDPSTNTLYVVALSLRETQIIQRLHALDVTTGGERPGSPVVINASVPGTGNRLFSSSPAVQFDPYSHKNRTGLLLLNGVVYTGWASHCDSLSYHGWIIAYDAHDLHQVAAFNTTPNANQGSFWMGGAAPAADGDGNIYAVSANGVFDANANGSDFGDSLLKLSSPTLSVRDYFTPSNQNDLYRDDVDFGSSTAVLLPDAAGSAAHPHLLVSAGKEGRIYLIDRDQMGHFSTGDDSQTVQSLKGAIGPLFGGPAYFNSTLYFAASYDTLKAFSISAAHLSAFPSSQSSKVFGYAGAIPVVTANNSADGIVWAVEANFGGTLHAYDSSNLANELYNSELQHSRDALGSSLPFSVPTVANGRVYVGTRNSLVVFGLLNQPSPAVVVNAATFQPGSVAPGSLIGIFGSNLANTTMVAAGGSLPRSLGGVTLSINGMAAPLSFVSASQINAQVPYEVTGATANAVLGLPGVPPVSFGFPVAPAAPAVFSDNSSQSVIRNEDGSKNSPGNPARVGSTVTVYLTGQGAVVPPVPTGEPAPDTLETSVYPISATVGHRAAAITFSGLSPGSVGLFEIHLIVPPTLSGSQPLVVTVNGVSSNVAHVSVSNSPAQTNLRLQ
jgi:uncharacterized protein (TIGR03437 family)